MSDTNAIEESDHIKMVIPAGFNTRVCFYKKVKWSRKRKGDKSATNYMRYVSESLIAWEVRRVSDKDSKPLPITSKGVVDLPYVLVRADNSLESPFFDEQPDLEEFIESMLTLAEPKAEPKLERVGNGMNSLKTITLKKSG